MIILFNLMTLYIKYDCVVYEGSVEREVVKGMMDFFRLKAVCIEGDLVR